MTITSRILAALLLAGATGSLAACGDDDNKEPSKTDSSVPGDNDGSVEPGDDAGQADGGTADSGPLPKGCPKGTTKKGTVCELKAAKDSPIVEDLTLEPVDGMEGYLLTGGVFIGEDVGGADAPVAGKKSVTLTIKPGTQIFGGDNLAFLLINRGSKIDAVGTKDNPIVFTSGGDPKPGGWGGVIINGRSLCNQGRNVVGEAGTGEYGGGDAADNSGTLKYVRIEWSGGRIDDRNELNGLALQGVGNGTTLDYIHVHGGNDDGIEFFGGTVNASHLIVTAHDDDAFDWTGGYSGKVQFGISQQWASATSSDPNGFEGDNNEQNELQGPPVSAPTFSNMTVVGASGTAANGHGAVLRRGTKALIHNAIVLDFKTSCISLRGANSQGFVATGELAFKNSRIAGSLMSYADGGNGTAAASAALTMAMFEDVANKNAVVADKNSVLVDAFNHTPDFKLKDTALLTAGEAPSDAFFEKVTFVGALGADDWTAGEWFKITDF